MPGLRKCLQSTGLLQTACWTLASAVRLEQRPLSLSRALSTCLPWENFSKPPSFCSKALRMFLNTFQRYWGCTVFAQQENRCDYRARGHPVNGFT